jgi:predicted phosphodiesterase
MKLGIFSDLHMEFEPWLFEPKDDVFYLNAGDTHPHKNTRDYFASLFTNDNYFSVMGNHDYYGDTFIGSDTHFSSKIVNGIKIAGAPLWTDLSNPLDWQFYETFLIDRRHISELTHDRMMLAHDIHKKFLLTSDADVIVSHHAPSYLSVAEQYKTSGLNYCFATELFEDIVNMPKPPKLWIHGHMHNQSDYMIGDTRVICHPRGYPGENAWYKNYEPLIVEI